MRFVAILGVTFVLAAGFSFLSLSGCGGGTDVPSASIPAANKESSPGPSPDAWGVDPEAVTLTANKQTSVSPAGSQTDFHPEVVIKTSAGDIRLRMNARKAPRTVENLLYNYVERGFYDQTVFHYVESGYLIAAGGFAADLQAKEARTPILCEADNGLKNLKGTIGMAHHPDHVHSATSQFYINLVDNPSLDYQPNDDGTINGYCVFGEVIEGMDVVEAIAASAVHDVGEFTNTPVAALVIESVRRLK